MNFVQSSLTIYINEVQRAVAVGQDWKHVQLQNAWNELLIKVVNISGDWGLFLQFNDPDMELKYSLKKNL